MTADPTLPTDLTGLRNLYLAERARRERAEAEVTHLHAMGRIPQLNPNPVLRLSGSGEVLFANAAASVLAHELQATGPSRVRSQLVQAASQTLRTGEVLQRELTANGKHYLLRAVPVLEDRYVMLYLTEVTAQRLAEQKISDQREFYEAILTHLPAVVTVLDPDQRYLYINNYADDSPAGRAARLGTTFADRCRAKGLPESLATRRHRLFEQAVRTRGLVNWEERWPGPDGAIERYWLCSYQPKFGPDGVLHQMMNYGLDITTRRLAEARSQQSEADVLAQQSFTEQLLDLNPNVIWVRDGQGRNVFENTSARHLREHIRRLAGTATMEEALDPELLKESACADQEVLRSNRSLFLETTLVLPSGETRWFQTVRCPLKQPDGTVQVLGVSTDITELKTAQHAAESAATARENFLANMSHEIRTPLNGVLGMTNLLAKTSLNEQQRNFTAIIQHSGRHLLSVVNDVLDMAKITSGKLEFEQAAFNICDAMGRAVGPLMVQAQEKGIRVVGTLLRDSCPHPWVVGDPYRLNQVLLNLLSNAIKFTPAGGTVAIGGYLMAETADTLTIEFRVADSGIGIAADKLESIFQEFTQAYADTTRQFGGTGLGLSISRALVAQMGGRLGVQSEVGKGSTFSFVATLPKASAEERLAAQKPVPPVHEAVVRGCRVLLVEDNAVNREVAQLLLKSHGVLVDEAASGGEALALFEEQRYDVVLMDIQMPGMNGLEATARIRAHADPVRAATPILALTANAFRADAEKYQAAGMNDTLPKPFEEAELIAKLAALITGADARPLAVGAPAVAPPAAPAAACPGEPATSEASLASNSASSNGLERVSFMPASRYFSASVRKALAVRARMGVAARAGSACARMRAVASRPFMPGIWMSISTTS